MLAYDMSRALKIPQQRTSWAQVYVNNINYGVFIIEEETNIKWLETYWSHPTGNLYKGNCNSTLPCSQSSGTWDATLDYLGDDPNLYKNYTTTYFHGRWHNQVYHQEVGYASQFPYLHSFPEVMEITLTSLN